MINDNLGSLFEGDPSAPKPMSLRQGVVEEWDSVTGDNSISVAGGVLVNVPVLTSESASLVVGDVVSLLTTDDRVLLLGKVTTPGDPGTVPTWIGDLTALAPLVPLAAVTVGLRMTGATNATTDPGTGAFAVLNDTAFPGELAIFSGSPDEHMPARLLGAVFPGVGSVTLQSPDLTAFGAFAHLGLGGHSDGTTQAELVAGTTLIQGTTALDLQSLAKVRVGDGIGPWVEFAGNNISNADLSDPSNVFPATLPPTRAVYKTADTTINNSTALATDPHLQIAGIDAGTYALDALIIYSASAVADWKGFMTGTGSLSDRLLQVLREPLSGNEYGVSEGAVTFTAAGNGVAAKRSIRIVGTFTATAGSQAYNLQWAQNTADPTDTVVHKGSYYRIQKIA